MSNNPYRYIDPTGLDKWSIVSRQQNYTAPVLSDTAGEAIKNVAGMLFTPVGFAQDYHDGGLGWAILGIVPRVSEIKRTFKSADKLYRYTDDVGLNGILVGNDLWCPTLYTQQGIHHKLF